MISFGGGYPNPETFAFREVGITFSSDSLGHISEDARSTAFQYGPTSGSPDLLRKLLSWHNERDAVSLDEANCAIVNGSQEGLFILSFLFLEQEDSVVIAEPAYPGIIMTCSLFTREIIPVALDDGGMKVGHLADILAHRRRKGMKSPKFIYTVPSGHNPTGVTASSARRGELLALAEEYDTLIIEDDPYRLIFFGDGEQPPTIQSLESTAKRVIRLDSFSKILAPGLRMGYVTGSPEIIEMVASLKQNINLQTGMLVQAFVDTYFDAHTSHEINEMIHGNRCKYKYNRDCMIDTARAALPEYIDFHKPSHGFFIWFKMPGEFDSDRMIREDSRRYGVLLVPGNAFAIRSDLKYFMRASFVTTRGSDIQRGIKRFSEMILAEERRIGKAQ